jgi:hypothetical protein
VPWLIVVGGEGVVKSEIGWFAVFCWPTKTKHEMCAGWISRN